MPARGGHNQIERFRFDRDAFKARLLESHGGGAGGGISDRDELTAWLVASMDQPR